MKELKLSEIWEICLLQMYDRQEYAGGLDKLLKDLRVSEVYDCACGPGFSAIDLHKKGYYMTCSDGSRDMKDRFNQNAEGKLTAELLDWKDLRSHHKRQFRFVMVARNSLIYVVSWDKRSIDPEEARKSIEEALQNFHDILTPGGTLYVDLYREDELREEKPTEIDLGKVVVGNDVERWKWKREFDWESRKMTWTIERTDVNTPEKTSHVSYAYALKHQELIEMLINTRFSKVHKIELEGEPNYTVYLARK